MTVTVTDELRKTLSDPKPLYALAGAGDLAAEKLKDAPALINEVAGSVTTLANKIAAEAPERIAKVQSRLAEVPGALGQVTALDPKAARETLRGAAAKADPQALREKAQTLALIQVGRVLEAAGKAVETYDELAERGKVVVGRYRGETVTGEVTVVVEQVVVEGPDDAETDADEPGTVTASAPADAPHAESAHEGTSAVEDAEVHEEEPAPAPRAKRTSASTAASAPASTPRGPRTAGSKSTASKSTSAKSGPTGRGAKN